MTGPISSFADLGLRPVVVHALRRVGVEVPFPIQSAAIPDALSGRDILGRAPTGSGKTLAFGLPLLHRLSGRASRPGRPRGVVLVPTRELALQIAEALEEPGRACGVRVSSVVGGVPLKRQLDGLRRGVDVVVATPGRLQDLVSTTEFSLDDVEITVLDEADRMADLGFLPQVESLIDGTPADGQRMLFSATLDGDVDILVERYLDTPVLHRTDDVPVAHSPVEHFFFRVTHEDKDRVAAAISARAGSTMLFLRTKHAVDRLTEKLRADGISAAALHGDKSQAYRAHTLDAFTAGSVPVLVATDVVARGIDVDAVSLVVHVDPPVDGKDYTHRAGRTGRAGRSGTVVTLLTESQELQVAELMQQAGITAAMVDVGPTSPELVAATGARRPSGIALSAVERTTPDTRTRPSSRRSTGSTPGRTRSRRSGRR